MALPKLPKMPKISNPVKVRADGKKMIWGLTGKEWSVTMFALITLWTIMGLIFTGLLAVATAVRDRGALYPRPGRDVCLMGEPCDTAKALTG